MVLGELGVGIEEFGGGGGFLREGRVSGCCDGGF